MTHPVYAGLPLGALDATGADGQAGTALAHLRGETVGLGHALGGADAAHAGAAAGARVGGRAGDDLGRALLDGVSGEAVRAGAEGGVGLGAAHSVHAAVADTAWVCSG